VKRIRHGIGAAVALIVVLAGGVWLYAAPPPDQAFVVPYRGYLEQNSAPLNGAVNLQFEYYADATSMTTRAPAETFNGVTVSGGRFTVSLGSVTAFPTNVFDQGPIYLGVSVNGTALGGRQQILPVPYATRTAGANHSAGDFLITGGARTLAFAADAGDAMNSGTIAYKPSYNPTAMTIVGAGTTIGGRSVYLYDNLTVSNAFLAGHLSLPQGTCPAGMNRYQVGQRTLCVGTWVFGPSGTPWITARHQCSALFNGAKLCSVSQMNDACEQGQTVPLGSMWYGDPTGFGLALRMNGNVCGSWDEVDATANSGTGGWCCLEITGW
jgi:hypothetical protein